MNLYDHSDATMTEAGTKVWYETEGMLRAFILHLYETQGIPVLEALLVIHDAAGAAAQHASNRIHVLEGT